MVILKHIFFIFLLLRDRATQTLGGRWMGTRCFDIYKEKIMASLEGGRRRDFVWGVCALLIDPNDG